ncbi:hypothetical protein ACFX2I_016264 [Malus domestica]|uniref:Cytochrome P450 n=1 Tax=Malus domestica TaxID=3750 RepID=A0A498HW58_MALDO|nr:hypothetical protein DVH24_012827 [Malus domestica]
MSQSFGVFDAKSTPLEIRQRYRVPAGTRLVVNVWKIHRNPRVWENTSAFAHKRFLESYSHIDVRGQQFKLMLFGSSRRSCPGVSFAMQVLHLTLARLLLWFKLKLRRPDYLLD